MKNISSSLLIVLVSMTAKAQWSDNGSNLTTSDNVGIGITTPAQLMHLKSSNPYIRLELDNNQYSMMEWYEGTTRHAGIAWSGHRNPKRLDFYTYNGSNFAERMSIGAGGDVGIGTTNPEAKLHIENTAGVNGTWLKFTEGIVDYRISNDGGRFKIREGTNDRFVIRSGGNIGIGTTSPDKQLHLYGNQPTLRLNDKTSNNDFWDILNEDISGDLRFFNSVSGTDLVTIKNSGKVGVGTTSPSFHLTIGNNLNNSYQSTPDLASIGIMSHGIGSAQGNLYLHRDDVTISQNNVLGSVLFTGADGGEQVGAEVRGVSAGSWSTGQSSSDLVFLTTTSGSGAPTEKMRLEDSGDLVVNPGRIFVYESDGGNIALALTRDTDEGYLDIYSAGSVVNRFRGNGDSYITSGNVGIGTTSPQSKLAVDGQIRATEVKVLADISVPDYVFEPGYELRTLKETKEYITKNKRLPEIPSAAEIRENGIDLGDMNMRLLKKIEELTLYQIELLEKLEQQNEQLQEQQERIDKLENQ